MKAPVAPAKDGIIISLYVQPGASCSEWSGLMDESLKLRIAARPVDGEANKEVCLFIARFLDVAKSCVTITHGVSGRRKTIHVTGPTEALIKKLAPVIEGPGT
jgi:uncharacterized protein (TIGR00251 family)